MAKPPGTLRIYYQNINGAKHSHSWTRWTAGHLALNNWQVDIAALVETNTSWTYTNIKEASYQGRTQHHKQFRITTAHSEECFDSDYKPGGSACTTHGPWIGRITNKIHDTSGLGRWTGFQYNMKHNRQLIVLSIYRPTKSQNMNNDTCYSQQWRILRKKNANRPDPRKQLIDDLIQQMRIWQNENMEVIMGIDANEPIDKPNSDILRLMNNTNLTTLDTHQYFPATHNPGTSCIDFILATPTILQATKQFGYLPFNGGAWKSDHRPLFADIDTSTLFQGDPTPLDLPQQRNLSSNNRIQTDKFLKHLKKQNQLQTLLQDLKDLDDTANWTASHAQSLETIDEQFTATLLQAEQKCGRQHTAPWSPTLHEAFLLYTYWKMEISGIRTRKSVRKQQSEVLAQLKDPNKI